MHIDTHSHWIPPSFIAAIDREAQRSEEFARDFGMFSAFPADAPVRRLDLRVEEMDGCGLDRSVLSVPPPGVTFGDRDERRRVAVEANDEILGAAAEHPGRFTVLVSLPLPHVEDALAELERVAGNPSTGGVSLLTVSEHWTPDDAALEPVYRRIAELGLPLVTHPAVEPLPAAWSDWALAASVGPVVSSTLGVARLALSGMLDRVPELDVVVPHLGGLLPYIAQRVADFGAGEAEHDLLHYLRERLWLDTCSFHPPAFRCALETSGVERLMLGSDYPFRGPLARAVQDVVDCVPDPDEQTLVLGATAARWFA
jgi:aminocarboxymuconate-semialdehyde decarboxylase